MDSASVYLQQQKVPELIDKLILRLVEDQPTNAKQFLRDQLYSIIESRFEGSDPDECLERTHPPLNPRATTRPVLAAKVLTHDMYRKLGRIRTSAGVCVDDCLIDGVAYHLNGNSVQSAAFATPPYGFLVGDGECYALFNELVDGLLGARLGGQGLVGPGGKSFAAPKSALGSGGITSGFQFPEKFVVGAAVSLRRNVQTFRMTSCSTRAERRALSKLLQRACTSAFQASPSTMGAFKAASAIPSSVDALSLDLRLPAGPTEKPTLAKADAEWPDARGSYVSQDGVFFANILSGTEHVTVATKAVRSHNVRDAFERVVQGVQNLQEALLKEDPQYEWQHHAKYGYLMSDLDALYGCGVEVHCLLRLPLLGCHPELALVLTSLKLVQLPSLHFAQKCNFPPTDVVLVRNKSDERPYALMEADLVQLACASIAKLIELEEVLLHGGTLNGRY